MRASIIIVTYGHRAVTERCLESLRTALGDRFGRDWQLVLVDNDSPDDTPGLLRAWSDRATVRLLGENRNFSGGCNAGAEVATGEVLIFLNNDTEVPAGALEALAEQALEPGVAIAGPRLLFGDGTIQHAGVAFLDHRDLYSPMPAHIFHHQDGELPAALGSFELDCVTAACMAVRAEAFRSVGGFDTAFINGLEDVDLCLRIRTGGGRIVYRGDVAVIHHEGVSRGRGSELYATPQKLAQMAANDRLLIGRWRALLEQDDELARTVWDAKLEQYGKLRDQGDADVLIVGQARGIGPAADEARALLTALTASGRTPATADRPDSLVQACLHSPLAELLATAQRRMPGDDSFALHVPTGTTDHWDLPRPSVVRLASSATAMAIAEAQEIWAASPSVARELVDAGIAPRCVRAVAPPVAPGPVGLGGGGLLAILPSHVPAAARRVLDAIRACGEGRPVRLLPTMGTRGLGAEVAERLPSAELLGPCSDEQRFAVLAEAADFVLAADPSDHFDRRALTAAATGAGVLTVRPGGPAAWVLGDRVACGFGELPAALAALLDEPGDRSERAELVGAACGPQAFARHLSAMPALVA